MYFTESAVSSTLIVAVFVLAINNVHGKCSRYCNYNPPIILHVQKKSQKLDPKSKVIET